MRLNMCVHTEGKYVRTYVYVFSIKDRVYACRRIRMHMCVHMYECTHVSVFVCMSLQLYTLYSHLCLCIHCIRIYVSVYIVFTSMCTCLVYDVPYIHICVYICTNVRMSLYVLYTHVCVRVWYKYTVYTYTCVHLYKCTHVS